MILLSSTVSMAISSMLLCCAVSMPTRTVSYFNNPWDEGDFVSSSRSLDNVYWWNKHFNQVDVPLSDDLPYFDDDYETDAQGDVKKRDYTAGQLVNMLKALAKARRQRNIRVAGKGLRFGISR